jgi:hypothetical protein
MSDDDDEVPHISYDDFIRRNEDRIPALGYMYYPPVQGGQVLSHCGVQDGQGASSCGEGSGSESESDSEDEDYSDSDESSSSERAGAGAPLPSPPLPSPPLDPKDLTFAKFEDLKKYVEKECGIAGIGMSNNKRTTRHPPVWFAKQFPECELAWLSGTLYCMQPRLGEGGKYVPWAKTSCTCHSRYVLCPKTFLWRIDSCSCAHNHAVVSNADEPSASGLVHYRTAAKLDQDMVQTINTWLQGKSSTKQIRYHFRNKYPNKDVKKSAIRSLRAAFEQRGARSNGMDALIKQLKGWEDEGGVGRIQYANMEISGIQFQHPLIREIAKVFGVVSTIDGTHNTTKFEKATLITCACQDSFGCLCPSGASYSATESEQSIITILEVLGLTVETLITDASKASFSVVEAIKCCHILCSYHNRKHLSTSLENVDATERKNIWDSVMKCLKWQGFKNDEELVAVSFSFLH